MNKKRNIVHINTEKSFRGGEIQTLYLIRELNKRGYVNFLVARPDSRILEEAKSMQIETLALNMRGEWDLISARKLRKWMKEQDAQILHAHTAHACSIALLARGKDESPRIVYSRRVTYGGKLLARKLRNVDAVIAVSQSIRKQLINFGVPQEKIAVAESATDFSVFENSSGGKLVRQELGIPENAFVIGNVSYFTPEKGQQKLIQVFLEISDPDSYLLLIGDGPNLEICKKAAGKSKKIVFTGFRKDVFKLYAAMDIFFLSSSSGEGWSGVLREAMGAGVPVIAVRQPSIEEQVQSGIIVSADQKEWRDAILKSKQNPSLRKELAQSSVQFAREFTIEAMADKVEEAYRKLLS